MYIQSIIRQVKAVKRQSWQWEDKQGGSEDSSVKYAGKCAESNGGGGGKICRHYTFVQIPGKRENSGFHTSRVFC